MTALWDNLSPRGGDSLSPQHPITRSWPRVPLGELCNLVNGDAYRDTDWSTSGVPIIRIQNLNNAQKPFNYWNGSLDNRVLVQNGDVLLAWSGTPGTSFGAHLWQRGQGLLNQHIFRVDLDSTRLDPQWAVFAINERLESLIGSASGAVGLRHVRRGEVEAIPILLPPLPEQQRISSNVREQLTEVERVRAAVQAQLDATQCLPAAHLRSLFANSTAHAWPRTAIGHVCRLLPSRSISLAGDTEVRAITSACLTETGFSQGGVKTARMWKACAQECVVQPGEILIARSNTPDLVGRVSIFTGEPKGVVASDLTIRLCTGPQIRGEFLVGYLSFLYTSGYWRERAGGASGTMKKITRSQIEAERIPVPSVPVQTSVADKLTAQLAVAFGIEELLKERITALDHVPAALLRAAFSGRT